MKQSGMFNVEWYTRGGYSDGSIRHYLSHGAYEGRDPHPLFSTRFYLEQNPDVAASGVNPLVHYLARGALEGRDPHPLFSARFYLSKNPDVAKAGLNPLIDYLSRGAVEGRDPHPWFDGRFYRSHTPDAASPNINPLWHYLSCGALSVGNPHPFFSNHFYHDQNPDAASSGINLLVHYLTVGVREGRLPCPKHGSHHTMEGGLLSGTDSELSNDAIVANWRKQILVIDDCSSQASSSAVDQLTSLLRNFHLLRFDVQFLPTDMTIAASLKTKLEAVGASIATAEPGCTTARDYLACHGHTFGIVYLRDVDAASELLHSIRAAAPGTTVVFHPSALPGIAQASTQYRKDTVDRSSEKSTSRELSVAARADVIVVNSSSDATALRIRLPDIRVAFFPQSSSQTANASPEDYGDTRFGLGSLVSVLNDAKLLPADTWRNYCATASPPPLPRVAPSSQVDVSIVIPVFNGWQTTKTCLSSILHTTSGGGSAFEIILADDGSSDDTMDADKHFPGVRIVKSEPSMGFVKACNYAAQQARGRYLLFVDHNSIAMPGWLDNLLRAAEQDERAAIVGSKILSPTGNIWSAGSTMFRDGTTIDIGRTADRHVPIMNTKREVDHVSSASVLIRRSFWESTGGFDGRYGDIACLDADLGMTARQLGFRVIYQPASEIILFGRSAGSRSLLVDKWRKALVESHSPPVSWALAMSGAERSRIANPYRKRTPGACHVLYFSPIPSHPVSHGNRATVYRFGRWMQQAGHRVHFALLHSGDFSARDAADMAAAWDTLDIIPFARPPLPSGADVPFDGAYEAGLGEKIRSLCSEHDIDVVICSYIFQSRLLEFVPSYIVKVIDTHDKMGNRYDMLRANGLPLEFFSCTPEEEGVYLRRADIVLARRQEEARYFDEVSGCRSAIVVPHFEPATFIDRNWEKGARHVGIVASANNVNLQMVHDCIVAIDRQLDGRPCPFILRIAGEVRDIVERLPEDQRKVFGKPWVEMTGFVKDIGEFYRSVDLILSPVTVGTGINVKTVQAMAFGMPLLTTQCGSKGIESGDPRHGHDGMADLVESLLEIVEQPAELHRLAEVSRTTYTRFHEQADSNMRSIFLHAKLQRWPVSAPAFDNNPMPR